MIIEFRHTAETALGTWFALSNEIHSTLQRAPVFKELTGEQMAELINLHDEFKLRVTEILRRSNKERLELQPPSTGTSTRK